MCQAPTGCGGKEWVDQPGEEEKGRAEDVWGWGEKRYIVLSPAPQGQVRKNKVWHHIMFFPGESLPMALGPDITKPRVKETKLQNYVVPEVAATKR